MIRQTFLLCGVVLVTSTAAQSSWWQTTSIYQVYPRSFQDSDGDGVGDIPGITSRLEYLAELGVEGVWLSPIYKSPMKDFGYDISDFMEVDPIFGTMDDFKEMANRAHELGTDKSSLVFIHIDHSITVFCLLYWRAENSNGFCAQPLK